MSGDKRFYGRMKGVVKPQNDQETIYYHTLVYDLLSYGVINLTCTPPM